MPIRMEQDPENQPRKNRSRRPAGGSGGMKSLGKFLPVILMFLLKKPKVLVLLLLGGAVWYYFLGGNEALTGIRSPENENNARDGFSFGASLDREEYGKAEVFEPLSAAYGGDENKLPPAISLLPYAPRRMHQGQQGSCVGWASSYAAHTILQARATGAEPNSIAFSPSYLYNQIALEGCQGAYMNNAMETLYGHGDLPFSQFDYDDRYCDRLPDPVQAGEAANFRIKGYNRLSEGADRYAVDLNGVKQHLAQGAPVVIGMMVGGTFMHKMIGRSIWQPTQRDYQQYGFSGHAMCVIGYDDHKQAVQIMNSWGPEWGDNGVTWVKYQDFLTFTKEAYGLYPMGDAARLDPDKLAVKFGLVENETQTLIPLQNTGDRTFRTRSPLTTETRFKIAITNSVECYIYVFGEESDGSSYVLFPYTEKHSPYCGITGTRLFPKDYSMKPDDAGSSDFIAIVISKKPLDWNEANSRINTSRGSNYLAKVREAVGEEEVPDVKFSARDAVSFSCRLNGKNVVAAVIEMDKN